MTSTEIVIRKKQYNPLTDARKGVVVFDRTAHKIYVGGECYSSEVQDATYNTSTKVLTIMKLDNTSIVLNFDGYETTSNKVTTLSSASTHTQYPSAKCVFDNIRRKPVVIWEAAISSQGILATETDIAQTMNNWQLTGLDMTPFQTVELYIRAGENPNLGPNYYTPSVVIEIDLDDINKSTFGHFIGSAIGQYPNNRSRMIACCAAISEDKTKIIFNRCTSLYGTDTTSVNDGGKFLYKVVGYYD